ncbi:hypothetical protein PAPYR_8899 [Paratrimastix pyriformis]|uniref:Uncharacterized protein n=1 Tax=Paratrimastix pyriformis TaxID=342808 RepID=A0ABQ8U9K0_9EUKA|nr:hypothetical protein PAPYR_8899 [Paratrimastix pyriformis]
MAIYEHPSLTSLDMSCNPLSPVGLGALQEAWQHNPRLGWLDIRGSKAAPAEEAAFMRRVAERRPASPAPAAVVAASSPTPSTRLRSRSPESAVCIGPHGGSPQQEQRRQLRPPVWTPQLPPDEEEVVEAHQRQAAPGASPLDSPAAARGR